MNENFRAAVLAWLQTKEPEAATVQDVTCFGTDWAVSTYEGFHERFEVTVSYQGQERVIGGEELKSLWEFVMNYDPDATP